MANGFRADDATLGFLYQFRFALLLALQKWVESEPFQVYLERADDVELTVTGGNQTVYQLKHKLKAAGNLQDKSPDWWKTIRVWCSGLEDKSIGPNAIFFLVTADEAPPKSAAAHLCADVNRRDVKLSISLLTKAAQETKNKKCKKGAEAFLALNAPAKEALVSRIYVQPISDDISSVDHSIRTIARPAVAEAQIESFMQRLEGWWVRQCVRQLMDPDISPIRSEWLDSHFDELRESFSRDNLPVDKDILELTRELTDVAGHREHVFVKQIEAVDASERRVLSAVRDYVRASTQRSRWAREELLLPDEAEEYEERLLDEWEVIHAQLCDELGPTASEEEMKQTGRRVLAWAESGAEIRLRAGLENRFIVKGSLHGLADRELIGWHPAYHERLRTIMNGELS